MRRPDPSLAEPLYVHSDGLQHMLLFTVALALLIGVGLFWLGRHGRVLWLTVWSAGLVLASLGYLGAYFGGWLR